MGKFNRQKSSDVVAISGDKVNSKLTQLETIFLFLKKHIATASMVSEATGVPQKNICRYKRDLEKAGRLWEIKKTICAKTGFRAWYLTTDPDKAPISNQLKLFGYGDD